MKKSILFLSFLFFSSITISQVSIIYYDLEYNEATDLFDCKMYIEGGSATTAAERLQLDAKYSVIVETGTTISIAENYLPIYNNETYTGTVPMNWSIESIEVNPPELPGFDIIGIVPDLGGQPAHYNDLSCCNTITLFSLSAVGDNICSGSLRIFENDYDPISLPSGNEYANSMMIGEIDDIYWGNQTTYSIWDEVDITIPGGTVCEGECFTLVPEFNCIFPGLTYEWSTDETTETITVCPEVSKNYYMYLSSPFSSGYEIEVLVKVDDGIYTGGVTDLCVGVPVSYEPTNGIWSSSDTDIVTVNNSGTLTPLAAGTATISHTTDTGTCLDEVIVTVQSLDPPIILDGDVLCAGETTQLSPTSGVTWESGNTSVATVDNTGLVTGVGLGSTVFTYTTMEGCISSPSPAVLVKIIPDPHITGLDTICTNESTTLSPTAGVTWMSSDTSIASIDNSGNVIGVSEGSTSFFFTDMATGCTSEESEPVAILPIPMVQLSADTVCQGESVFATTSFEGGTWEIIVVSGLPNIPTIDSATGEIFADEPGVYGVHHLSADGCISNEVLLTILPKPDVQVSSNSPVCGGENLIISSISPPGSNYDYLWTGPSGWWSDEPNIIIANPSIGFSGTFLLVVSENGCESEVMSIDVVVEDCNPCDDETSSDEWIKIPVKDDPLSSIRGYEVGSSLVSGRELEDFVYYNFEEEEIRLVKNTGNRYFDEEVTLFTLPNLGWDVRIDIVDIDQDGLNDLVVYQSEFIGAYDIKRFTITALKNYDNYLFENKLQIVRDYGNLTIFPVEYFDLDNQGYLDLVPNTGPIYFTDNWEDVAVEMPPFSETLLVDDFNQDDYLDILRSDEQLLLNNGDRTFTPSATNGDIIDSKGLYNKDNGVFIDGYFTYEISAGDVPTITVCNDPAIPFGQDYFYANINSSTSENGVITTLDGFHVFDTPLTCENSFFAKHIQDFVPRPNGKIDLTGNGYSDFVTVENNEIFAWINPIDQPKIRGIAFIDNNGDGMLNENDSPLRNVLVSIEPGNLSVLTDDDGNYQLVVPEGTYTLTAKVNEGDWVMDELTIENVEINEPCNLGFDFGFEPDPSAVPMVNLSMVNTIARCDFETKFTITVENTGTESFESQLEFEFDDKTTFFSTEIAGASVVGNKVLTDIGPLTPFQPEKYIVTVKMPAGSSVLPMLDFKATLVNESGEIIKEYGYAEQLRCSYDPNDKREYPNREGDENLTLMDEDIEYTIRFQNNGNDTAYTVKIVDPLDAYIDPSSIRVVGSSHAVETCIEGTDLIFLFEDIFLVDSTTNYAGSQGYVTFKCNVKAGLAEFTKVNNTAEIFFDTNLPISTNQTLNTLVSVLCTDKTTVIDEYICYGEEYLGFTESGTYTESFELPYGCDSLVTINLTVQGITVSHQTIDVCEPGFISIGTEEFYVDESTIITDTIINDLGCISTVIKYEITLVPDIIDIDGSLDFCLNELASIYPNLNGVWSSDDESVIQIDDQGNITTISAGTANLQFAENETGCLDEIPVVVHPDPKLTNEGSDEICIDETNLLTADSDGFWSSSNPEIASITIDGLVQGKSAGTVTFTFTSSTTQCSKSIDMVVLPNSDSNCTVSTQEILDESVRIYPNPARGFIFIESQVEWNAIRLVNSTGQVVLEDKNMKYQAKSRIDMDEIPSGLYLVVIESEGGAIMKKIVVQ